MNTVIGEIVWSTGFLGHLACLRVLIPSLQHLVVTNRRVMQFLDIWCSFSSTTDSVDRITRVVYRRQHGDAGPMAFYTLASWLFTLIGNVVGAFGDGTSTLVVVGVTAGAAAAVAFRMFAFWYWPTFIVDVHRGARQAPMQLKGIVSVVHAHADMTRFERAVRQAGGMFQPGAALVSEDGETPGSLLPGEQVILRRQVVAGHVTITDRRLIVVEGYGQYCCCGECECCDSTTSTEMIENITCAEFAILHATPRWWLFARIAIAVGTLLSMFAHIIIQKDLTDVAAGRMLLALSLILAIVAFAAALVLIFVRREHVTFHSKLLPELPLHIRSAHRDCGDIERALRVALAMKHPSLHTASPTQ